MAVFARAPTCKLSIARSDAYVSLTKRGILSILADGVHSFKALALGADFVQVGRPMLWGLAHQGEKGVRHVLKSLLAELEITVGLAGHTGLKDVDRSSVSRAEI
jgi:hypothetical protein